MSIILDVITKCKANPAIAPNARVVGRWVWVEFQSKPTDSTIETLKDWGFFWNRKRKAWQHSCGWICGGNRKVDPRMKYNIMPVSEVLTSEVA